MPQTGKKLSPMMERYHEVKRQNPGSLLLFRMGDFYELFHEDAQVAAKVLGLTLTSRDKNAANPTPMAGFPYHSLDGYLQKLIQSGHRAAICEQVEDPKKAQGLVKREVTRVVTPGTLTEDGLLDPRENNYLAAVSLFDRRSAGLAWLEVSTGRFVATDVDPKSLPDELARLRVAELLIPDGGIDEKLFPELKNATDAALLTERPAWCFAPEQCRQTLLDHFQVKSLEGFDIEDSSPGVVAAGVLLEYLHETQRSALGHISRLEPYRRGSNLNIDEATRRSLELTHTMRNGSRDGSLLAVIDETVTPMGARLLSEWLSNPLTDLDHINRRLDAVEEFHNNAALCQDLREQLERTYDLQRLTARIATGRATPRDLNFLNRTLALLPKLKAKLAGRSASLLQELEANLDLCSEIRADVEAALVDDPPATALEGGMIRDGFHAELDELRDLARGGKAWMTKYQAEEIQRTGIPSMKIGFNKVFGYYLEVTATHLQKVPEHYIRKQTLKNQERYVTPELKEHEEKVLRAEERAFELEAEMFQALRERVAEECRRVQITADVLARVDVLVGLAILATSRGYCRPEVTAEPILDIREGRHPVLDRLQPTGQFVPNDARLGVGGAATGSLGRVQIITGPNMAGKSTYIRQAALITVMAQMGSFVPASEARVGVADRIFARVGASDELGKGQSTFMVEMTETARILNSATDRSLVILDEIGRGTSTYDGISLAWAVTEYLHDVTRCRTMFATHYHELTELTQTLKHASNWNVAVREQSDDVIFLHRIIEGAADKSYGIHVARLAGVPHEVIDRARVILNTLESDHLDASGKPKVPKRKSRKSDTRQKSLFGADDHPLLDSIRELDVEQMTPNAALEKLQQMRDELK
ncbi:MAG: DNA mismatch repair protein MutS [Planctomycetota bacterium]|nr:DNA mismatch repair protein MutS [Planctomycetota bacterium]